ncbi:hypothetical protein NHQ30_008897 [Ciborinia camelliae]|nr:hypothetical protein NHQ30_008897 [Ciborinia camelliae]
MSEVEWLSLRGSTIKRAAMVKMICKDQCLDDVYRRDIVAADTRGLIASSTPEPKQNTDNAVADCTLNFLRQGLRVAEGLDASRG